MALSKSHRIIWLDTFIGRDGDYKELKQRFMAPIEPAARVDDPFDRLVHYSEQSAAPFIFVHQIDQAMQKIRETQDFQVIFISSGSLGRHIIPQIHPQHVHVYSFYILREPIVDCADLIIDYLDVIQIFDHEIDLLVRLIRDLSLELIDRGSTLLDANRPVEAKDVFERARNMERAANHEDASHPTFERLQELGDENHPGLIQRAEQMIIAQYGPQIQPVLQAEGDDQFNMDEPQDSPIAEEAF